MQNYKKTLYKYLTHKNIFIKKHIFINDVYEKYEDQSDGLIIIPIEKEFNINIL